nr:MAG TPA: hypothetical protein [Caudoviricetes sp.]
MESAGCFFPALCGGFFAHKAYQAKKNRSNL